VSIKRALKGASTLHRFIRSGKQAVRSADRARIDDAGHLVDSLDLEEALPADGPSIKRFDYLLGTNLEAPQILGLEVHPANTGEARIVVAKKQDTARALRPHLAAGATIKHWYWVASGPTGITRNTPQARLLDQNGIRLVGSHFVVKPERSIAG
jgi:hypothetical protein